MEYRSIRYWQYEPGEEEKNILESAIALSIKERSDNFLYEVAEFISIHTKTDFVLIGQLSDDSEYVNTLAMLGSGKPLENFSYSLKGTPCDVVITQRFCYHPHSVALAFPEDKELKEMQIESYLGSILLSSENEPLGVITLMDKVKIDDPAFAEHLILVLSPAIEDEIKKMKSKQVISKTSPKI